MGFLKAGRPLPWQQSLKHIAYLREHGVRQFLEVFRRVKDRRGDVLKWGDEIEFHLVVLTAAGARIALIAPEVLARLEQEESEQDFAIASSWRPEYGSWMVEATPGHPYGNQTSDLAAVEANMATRRARLERAAARVASELLDLGAGARVVPLTVVCFPRMGVGAFTEPALRPGGLFTRSSYVPDAVLSPHPRFGTLTANIRARRGSRMSILVPLAGADGSTHARQAPTVTQSAAERRALRSLPAPSTSSRLLAVRHAAEEEAVAAEHEPLWRGGSGKAADARLSAAPRVDELAAQDGFVHADSMAFGMGCCCLQVTFQARDLDESLRLYDALAVLSPLVMALTAATPVFRGRLVATDTRWDIIADSVDDRTPFERPQPGSAEGAEGGEGAERVESAASDTWYPTRSVQEAVEIANAEARHRGLHSAVAPPPSYTRAPLLTVATLTDPLAEPDEAHQDDEETAEGAESAEGADDAPFVPDLAAAEPSPSSSSSSSSSAGQSAPTPMSSATHAPTAEHAAGVPHALAPAPHTEEDEDEEEEEDDEEDAEVGVEDGVPAWMKEGAEEERRQAAGEGRRPLLKSRYSSIDCFVSSSATNRDEYSDLPLAVDEDVRRTLLAEGVPRRLAAHVAHLFVRDPLVVFGDSIELDDAKAADHWENFQSTNWNSVRWKPPPPGSEGVIGWRVELRTMEVAPTDFENAAFTVLATLLSRVILFFDLNIYIPISLVDANFAAARQPSAASQRLFYFRRKVTALEEQCGPDGRPLGGLGGAGGVGASDGPEWCLMTLDEILMGRPGDASFPGLVPLISAYLDHIQCDADTRQLIEAYLRLAVGRARGEIQTPAEWIRDRVRRHPDYRHDGVVHESIAADLLSHIHDLASGKVVAPELVGPLGAARVAKGEAATLAQRVVAEARLKEEAADHLLHAAAAAATAAAGAGGHARSPAAPLRGASFAAQVAERQDCEIIRALVERYHVRSSFSETPAFFPAFASKKL